MSLCHVTCRRAPLSGDPGRPPAHTLGTTWRPHARHRRAPARGRQALPATAARAPQLGSAAPRLTWPRPGSGPHAGPAPRPAPARAALLLGSGTPRVARGWAGPGRGAQGSQPAGPGSSSEPPSLSSRGAPGSCLVQGPAWHSPHPGAPLSLRIHVPILGTGKVRCGAGTSTRNREEAFNKNLPKRPLGQELPSRDCGADRC